MSNILIHIGFAKAGSSYLQRWFKKHPHLYYNPKQFAEGFFHAWEMTKFAQNATEVPDNFVMSCEDISIWQGELEYFGFRGTAPYNYRNYQNVMCEMLHRIYPTAKILIVTRGYTTIFKSIYAQYIGMSGTLTFKEMIDNMPDMLTTFTDYSYIIELYRSKFGQDNVIVLPYELLRDNSSRFLSIIEQQIGVTEKFEFAPNKVNAGMDDKILYVYQRASLLVYNILKPLPRSFGTKLYKGYMRMVRRRKLHKLFVSISGLTNKPINLDGLDETIASMKGKAEVLRNNSLYQEYLKEYLL